MVDVGNESTAEGASGENSGGSSVTGGLGPGGQGPPGRGNQPGDEEIRTEAVVAGGEDGVGTLEEAESEEEERQEEDEEGLKKDGYDVIICGTGLVQSILSAALSRNGWSVMHCDGSDHYGELDAVLPLSSLVDEKDGPFRQNAPTDAGETEVQDGDLHSLGGLAGLQVHSATSWSAISQTQNPLEVGMRVVTPYGQGTVLHLPSTPPQTAVPPIDSIAVSLANWTLANGKSPILYCGRTCAGESHHHDQILPLRTLLQQRLWESRRSILVDLSPRLLFATGEAVDGIVQSSVSSYCEFKSLSGLFILGTNTENEQPSHTPMYRHRSGTRASTASSRIAHRRTAAGPSRQSKTAAPSAAGVKLSRVPCSKGDVFQTNLLSPSEKRQLMRFLQLASDYATAMTTALQTTPADDISEPLPSSSPQVQVEEEREVLSLNERQLRQGRSLSRPQNKTVSTTELTELKECIAEGMPFNEYLQSKQKLPDRLRELILYAMALATSASTLSLSTERGMEELCRHLLSLGRYGTTAFLVPMYGSGELSQSFCRSSAVHGGTFLLRRTPRRVLLSDNSNESTVRGILLGGDPDSDGYGSVCVDDKEITSKFVVAPRSALSAASRLQSRRIARRVSIINGKLIQGEKPTGSMGEQRHFLVFPPRTGQIDNPYAIHGIAVDDSVGVAPLSVEGVGVLTVLHLTTTVEADQTTDDSILSRATQAVIATCGGTCEELFHYSFSYVDDASDVDSASAPKGLFCCNSPAQTVTVEDAFREAKAIFQELCPDATFLALSQEMDEAIQRRMGRPNDGDDDDDEGMLLESAISMIREGTEGATPAAESAE